MIIMISYSCNRIKYYNIIVHVAFITFNDGDFQIQLFSNTVLAILEKIMYMKLYRI